MVILFIMYTSIPQAHISSVPFNVHIIDLTEFIMKDVEMCAGRILLFCVSFQEAHVNQCYKHFYYFVTELNLVERKELEPLVSQLLLRI